jgi:molybdopterin biosynthesis enzyme
MTRLIALDQLLPPLLDAIEPLAPTASPLEHAVGLPLAADLVAPNASPAAPIALRAGLAVAALDLVGASTHSPVMLSRIPRPVKAGDALPPGCDAILDPSAVSMAGPLAEVTDAVEPGAHVRLMGHDLGAGDLIGQEGGALTGEMILAAKLAGLSHVMARVPASRIELPYGPEAAWLRRRLQALGVSEARSDTRADVVFALANDAGPRLALRPGEDAFVRRTTDGAIEILLPNRFDAMVGAWCALVLPIIARRMDLRLAIRPLELSRKVASSVGLSEIALLRGEDGKAQPLAVGDLTLAAIAAANAFAVLPASSEGLAAGEPIEAVMLDKPFEPRKRPT